MTEFHRLSVLNRCCCSVAWSCLTLCDPMDCSTPGLSVLHHLPQFVHVHVHCISDAVQPSHLLTPYSPPALNFSQHQGLFQWVNCSHQMTKYWSFSFNTSPSDEYSGLISFRIDWSDLLGVQGTLRSLLQYLSLKASLLWHSAFFTVQLSQLYVTTGNAMALTMQTFVGRVMSLTLPKMVLYYFKNYFKQILSQNSSWKFEIQALTGCFLRGLSSRLLLLGLWMAIFSSCLPLTLLLPVCIQISS